MIGVVVWSNGERQKAVIWCEDQGALAYLQGWESLTPGTGWPATGDLLELDSEMVGDLRFARSVSMLNRHHYVELPDMLMDAVSEERPMRLAASGGKRIEDSPNDVARHGRLARHLAVCAS
ncbi:hypothetical protein [Paracoccus tegillarcae]|uniref:Uncharacterized protein n=1 Tax=Paracoccus tegillarcae TaxID=1529068 RepID=A0A2K9EYS2_9RHOB|nr:hypothetical protein [Paracoccus tegillarcae]AUH34464.1 hypothetical protein CUV01_14675 [Paracoccus tegillarcae]